MAAEEGKDEIDHRPAEAEQQADRAGEIRDREVRPGGILAGLPGDHGLDGELGEGLQPRKDREGEPLGDEELRRFRAPGHEERGEQDAGERPQRRDGRASRLERGGE